MKQALVSIVLGSVLGSVLVACSGAASVTVEQGTAVEETGAPSPPKDPPSEPPAADVGLLDALDDTGAPDATPEASVDAAKPLVCASATGVYDAVPTPHDVLFLLDRSGSMHSKVASGSTRWQAAENALFSLLDTIAEPATRAGLDMFPRGDAPITCCWIDPSNNYTKCSCKSGELPGSATRCAQSTYASALVPVAPLNAAQKSSIRSSVHTADAEFYWGTPMRAALAGAIAKQAALDLDTVRSVVLVTDGEPTSCNAADDKIDAVVSAAKAGLTGAKPVQTYVVGVIDGTLGADATNLSKVAVAGGTARSAGCEATSSCFYAVDAKSFEGDIAKAFKDIEMKAFSCTFDVPSLASGLPDYDLMNVSLKKSDGSSVTVPHDATKAEGWELTTDKKKVQLHGSACASMKAEPKTQVQIVLGCKTVEK